MGVYIKGMEMPENCCECPVNMNICKRGYKYLLEHPELYDSRAEDCPIIPVPDHGRLVDADAFERRCMFDSNIEDMQDVIYALRDYPTIIPADKEADNG